MEMLAWLAGMRIGLRSLFGKGPQVAEGK